MTVCLGFSLPKVLCIRRTWPYVWGFPCQKYCVCAVHDRMFGVFPAKSTVYTPYKTICLVFSLPLVPCIRRTWPYVWGFPCQKYQRGATDPPNPKWVCFSNVPGPLIGNRQTQFRMVGSIAVKFDCWQWEGPCLIGCGEPYFSGTRVPDLTIPCTNLEYF